MAYQASDGSATPHATDYADLLAKLVTFATANGWAQLESSADKTVLKSTGSTGTDAIIVAIQPYADVASDSYGWYLNGYTGYSAGLGFLDQPGALQQSPEFDTPSLPLSANTIQYWFFVSARRIMVVAKVGTVYLSAYLGYFLPFATPHQYPYPLVIGGSAVGYRPRYSNASNHAFVFGRNPFVQASARATVAIRLPDGSWYFPNNFQGGALAFSSFRSRGVFPYLNESSSAQQFIRLRPALSGEYSLQPIYIATSESAPDRVNLLGEFEGLHHVTGYGNTVENVISVGARNFIVFNDVYRTGALDFFVAELA